MAIVLDYSNWRPHSAQALTSHGVIGVMRYVAPSAWHWPKAITLPELTQLRAAGLSVGFNFEKNPGDWRGGYAAGLRNGNDARTAMIELGISDIAVPVFPSFDEYINPVDFDTASEYARGFREACKHRPGAYAEGALIEFLHGKGLCDFGWESESTSFPGNSSPTAHTVLVQHYGQQVSGLSGAYDVNTTVKPDWGQYPRPAPPTPAPEVKVQPRFNPPLSHVVDALAIPNVGSWLLRNDGAIYTDEGVYHGGTNNLPAFTGRVAARLVAPNTQVPGANPPVPGESGYTYVVIAESGERYGCK